MYLKPMNSSSKGVSPVVAVVLLIAIAVISAVAVWYWVAPLTARPSTGGDISKSISVTKCFAPSGVNSSLSVRNTGGVSLSTTIFAVHYADNGTQALVPVGNAVAILNGTLASGATVTLNVTGLNSSDGGIILPSSTAYFLRTSGIPDAPFSC